MKLWVIRHAKSSWAQSELHDFDRPLNARGEADGARMIDWLRARKRRPELIVSSDAARARATAEFVRIGCGIAADRVQFDHRIYLAPPETLLEVVRSLPPDCTSAALVGHNPGSSELVNALVGEAAIDELPTLGVAILSVPAPWSDVRFGVATLKAVHTPKSLRD